MNQKKKRKKEEHINFIKQKSNETDEKSSLSLDAVFYTGKHTEACVSTHILLFAKGDN